MTSYSIIYCISAETSFYPFLSHKYCQLFRIVAHNGSNINGFFSLSSFQRYRNNCTETPLNPHILDPNSKGGYEIAESITIMSKAKDCAPYDSPISRLLPPNPCPEKQGILHIFIAGESFGQTKSQALPHVSFMLSPAVNAVRILFVLLWGLLGGSLRGVVTGGTTPCI